MYFNCSNLVPTDEEKTVSNRNLVQQKNAENSIDGTMKSLKENGNKKDTCSESETVEISEEERPREFDTHRAPS